MRPAASILLALALCACTAPADRFCADLDGDGSPDLTRCEPASPGRPPSGQLRIRGTAPHDCDDTRAIVHPGVIEICGPACVDPPRCSRIEEDLDEDCDGLADEADPDCTPADAG